MFFGQMRKEIDCEGRKNHEFALNSGKSLLSLLAVFFLYFILTLIIFKHRWLDNNIFDVYSMSDNDTDGTIWYVWLKAKYYGLFETMSVIHTISYPFGHDVSHAPFYNLIDEIRAELLRWANLDIRWLIFIVNASALITYPLASFFTYIFLVSISKARFAAFLGGIIFGFNGMLIFHSRGSMSINHPWLLPLIMLFIWMAYEKKRWWYLLLAGMITSLQFAINAYWGFFAGLIGFLFYLALQWGRISALRSICSYVVFFAIGLFLFNFQYIADFYFLIIDPVRSALVRPEGQIITNLLPAGVVLFPNVHSLLYPFYGNTEGGFLGYIPITIFIASLLIKNNWQNRLYMASVVGVLSSLALSTYFPAFYPLNKLYFEVFGTFRGVSRIIMFTSLFLAVIVIFTLSKYELNLFSPRRKLVYHCIVGLLMAAYILEVFPTSSTIYDTTDFSKVRDVYSPLRKMKNITAIAGYPMTYSNINYGGAPLYELLGQVVHEKPIAGAKDLRMLERDPGSEPFLGDINDSGTIDRLKSNGINTIIIYNKLLSDSGSINKRLKSDTRAAYVGRYHIPEAECGHTLLCRSLDYSVYTIL